MLGNFGILTQPGNKDLGDILTYNTDAAETLESIRTLNKASTMPAFTN